jgi:GTP-binding protein HflX
MQVLHGNLSGLKPSQQHMLERIYRRKMASHEVVSDELAAFLCECSREINRQVGVLIDRSGSVTHVIVGEPHRLFLPDLGRQRAGRGRLRGLRLVHTHLRAEALTRDDLMDLAKLRLDLVAAIAMTPGGLPGRLHMAHLLPPNAEERLWRELPPVPAQRGELEQPFDELIRALEDELQRGAAASRIIDDDRERALVVQVLCSPARGRSGVRRSSTSERGAAGESMARLLPTPPAALGNADAAWNFETRGAELRELCRTAGLQVVDVITQRRPEPDPHFLLGRGKLDEVVLRALQHDATLLVFDPELTPAQARAISDATELKVIDRTMLILDIFAQHAHSRDGKLQVELAQLRYALPRLIEKNTMMSRLTGGIGGRGPGETKLEINRRRARERITLLSQGIADLSRQRAERRKQRQRRALPVIAIIGYTNAGKSTLLNALSYSQVLVANKLFATLDPTSRRMRFPDERELILTDTVGFIRDLPADLKAAFSATLEELHEADLLLHVLDASDPAVLAHRDSVERLLREMDLFEKPRLLVWNKVDRLDAEGWLRLSEMSEIATAARLESVALSASQPDSLRPLLLAIDHALATLPARQHWQGWGSAVSAP